MAKFSKSKTLLTTVALSSLLVTGEFLSQENTVEAATIGTNTTNHQGNTLNLVQSYGAGNPLPNVQIDAYLNQPQVMQDSLQAFRQLRSKMWHLNPPFNGSNLQAVAASHGLTTHDAYVNAGNWDSGLEMSAIQRASEIRQAPGYHQRLDGSSYSNAVSVNGQAPVYENIAWGQPHISSAIEWWGERELHALQAANGHPNSQNGHLHNFLNPNVNGFAFAQVGDSFVYLGTYHAGDGQSTGYQGNYVIPQYNPQMPAAEIVEAKETIETVEEITEIPFETEYTENNELTAGEQRILQPGVNGKTQFTYKVTKLDGEIVSKSSPEQQLVIQQPVTQIIEIGTKLAEAPVNSEASIADEETESQETFDQGESIQANGLVNDDTVEDKVISKETTVVKINSEPETKIELKEVEPEVFHNPQLPPVGTGTPAFPSVEKETVPSTDQTNDVLDQSRQENFDTSALEEETVQNEKPTSDQNVEDLNQETETPEHTTQEINNDLKTEENPNDSVQEIILEDLSSQENGSPVAAHPEAKPAEGPQSEDQATNKDKNAHDKAGKVHPKENKSSQKTETVVLKANSRQKQTNEPAKKQSKKATLPKTGSSSAMSILLSGLATTLAGIGLVKKSTKE